MLKVRFNHAHFSRQTLVWTKNTIELRLKYNDWIIDGLSCNRSRREARMKFNGLSTTRWKERKIGGNLRAVRHYRGVLAFRLIVSLDCFRSHASHNFSSPASSSFVSSAASFHCSRRSRGISPWLLAAGNFVPKCSRGISPRSSSDRRFKERLAD